MFQEGVRCPHCNRKFVLNGYRLTTSKTVSCLYCEKRFERYQNVED